MTKVPSFLVLLLLSGLLGGAALAQTQAQAQTQTQADLNLSGRTLSQREGSRVVWQRSFPASMGPLSAPLVVGDIIYVGAGPAVYALSESGEVLGRADLPAPVASLDAGGGVVRVDTQANTDTQATMPGGIYTERFTLTTPHADLEMSTVERVVLPPLPQVTGWLAQVADRTPAAEVEQAAKNFPDNPFLLLRLAQMQAKADNQYGALSQVRQALALQMPFAAWTQLAARLDALGYPGAADLALEKAKKDAAARGLDPALAVSRAALGAYGNPSGYVGTLLAQNRLSRAAVWMNFLRDLYPRFEGHDDLYRRYADLLEAQGKVGEAEDWRQFNRSLAAGSLYNLGEHDLQLIRLVARLSALTLLTALLAAWLTLGARAWKAQGQDTQPLGGRFRSWWLRPLARARYGLLSYARLSERLMLATLALALVVTLGGWLWANQTQQSLNAPALNSGTYGGGWYSTQLDDLNLRPTPDTAILTGLAAQLDGDDTAARQAYTQAGADACALNNLGTISQEQGDQPQAAELYRAALALRPELAAAQYNLGLPASSPEGRFQRVYHRGQPRLCYPDRRNLARAVSGDLSVTLRQAMTRPLDLLSTRLGRAMLLSGLLLMLLVFLLLIPRAATSQRLGRPPLYRLLATLFPGTGLLSNPWGAMLLLAWAAELVLLLPLLLPGQWWAWQFHWTKASIVRNGLLLALIAAYSINIVALSVAEAQHFRRNRSQK